MNIPAELSLLMFFTGLAGLILLFPLPGVDAETEISFMDENISVELVSSPTLDSGNHWGSHDIMTHDIKVATGSKGILPFVSTCSHELYHVQYQKEFDDPLSREEEHERMGQTFFPWNWKYECLELIPTRFAFL